MSAPQPIRVLVVDDSLFVRTLLRRMLLADGRFEVAGEAKDGAAAVELAVSLAPDVVTMDVIMPGMDGVAAVRALLQRRLVPVVMLSAHTTEGARTTLDALAAGAVDFVAKPSGERSTDLSRIAAELCDKLAAAARIVPRVRPAPPLPPPRASRVEAPPPRASRTEAPSSERGGTGPAPAPPASLPRAPVSSPGAPGRDAERGVGSARGDASRAGPLGGEPLVALGISTGGPSTLLELLPRLPASAPALLVVQHMPTGFTAALAERLDGACAIEVREAKDGDRPRRGLALVAPGGSHLEYASSGHVRLGDGPPVHGCKPSVDVTMLSVARFAGRRAIGVVMTGMGRDGADGLRAMRRAGARTLAQDEASSVVYGMPRAAFELGAAEEVVSLDALAARIVALADAMR
ncbi:MAG: chemotaxis response regulator protein-glutamate methylesterase [Polyangiaceae bacterium]|nr:chemotaxis response regulator protein-glutamate methylesterase [Polyangiaceae bacterium]